MNKQAIVIGGGLAGLAAASTLASRGMQVILLEAASQLGGRARSVAIEHNSQIVQLDNGQHIMLGAYTETLKLLASVGVNEADIFLRTPLKLDIRNKQQVAFKLATPSFLSAPLNQLIGFLSCYGLTMREVFSVIKLVLRLKKSRYQISTDQPLSDFLQNHGQSANTMQLLWEPLCLAALNTPINIASSKVFLNVLRDTFASKTSADFLLPKHDLSHILALPIARHLSQNKAKVLLNQRVKNIEPHKNGYLVHTKKTTYEASHIILALSANRLDNVVVSLPKLHPTAELLKTYTYQPIYTIYLQYAADVRLESPMIGLNNSLSQWVFDRGALCGQHGLMAVIISAEGAHQTLTQDALALKVAQELHDAFAQLKKPLWHKVIAEKRATFTCATNMPRPAHVTPYPGLYLAGDYTYADYPATIEGAVRSGIKCADFVCNN